MEIQKVIEYLNQQRTMIDETIVCLERLAASAPSPLTPSSGKRRGRKFMNEEDRQKVSERMRQYWASRRPETGRTRAAV